MGRSKDVLPGAYGERRVVLLHVVTFTLYGQKCICRILKTHFVPRSKHSALVIKADKLILYREIIAVCSEIRKSTSKYIVGRT
jgi:hypothetical protein